jgi:alpha-glucosidase
MLVCTVIPNVNCDGSTDCCLDCITTDPTNTLDFPPFTPNCAQGSLSAKTFAMSAIHAGGVKEYDAHNLYGFQESIATQVALETVTNKRAFMVTRSTFAGSGKYAAHWTGDNVASWNDLSASITTMNNLALFGIPMVGADICGFLENTTPELCTRWIQVGAFSPFSRNHNGLDATPQELYRWESVAEASRTVLNLRYRLLPYLYTLMYNAHSQADTVLNAMWMHFPEDREAFFRDGQYMWSDGLLFTPVLLEGATSVEGHFPRGLWYSLFDDSLIDAGSEGLLKVLDTPLLSTNAHARGGTVIPTQQFRMTTAEAKVTPVTLLIALDAEGAASGSLFMDDGEQIAVTTYSEVAWQVITAEGVIALTSTVLSSLYACPTCTLGAVEVFGVTGNTCTVLFTEDNTPLTPLPYLLPSPPPTRPTPL